MGPQSSTYRRDPLSEILLCPTADRAVAENLATRGGPVAGDRPVDSVGRRRSAILDGARRAVQANGAAITMAQVAARSGLPTAAVYDHFRAREDVLAALLLDEIDQLISRTAHLELSKALTRAGAELSAHPLLEAIGYDNLELLAVMARVDVRSSGWLRVAVAVEGLLSRAGRAGTATVLRWLSSFLLAPACDRDVAADVEVLLAGLPARS